MNHSPQEAGDSNLAKVEAYLGLLKAEGRSIPLRNGRVNIDQLAKDCGLKTRQPFYTNKSIRAAVAAFSGEARGLESLPDRKELDEVRSKLLRAEQQIAALRAENDLLKAINKELLQEQERQQALRDIALCGRRVIE
jgi:hypothetical protein